MLFQSTHCQGLSKVCEWNLSEFGNVFPGWNRGLRGLFLVGGSLVTLLACRWFLAWHWLLPMLGGSLPLPDLPCPKNIPGVQVPTPLCDMMFLCAFRVTSGVTPGSAAFLQALFEFWDFFGNIMCCSSLPTQEGHRDYHVPSGWPWQRSSSSLHAFLTVRRPKPWA